MAVAFDAVGPSASGTTSAASPLTWTHVCGASATHLLAGATWDGSPDGGGSMSATYNGVAMTSLGVWHTGGATAGFLQVWSLALPAAGSHSVSITAGGSPAGLNAGSVSFTGSGGISAVQSAVSPGNSANPSLTFTGSVAGNQVVAFVGGGSPQTPSGSFTSRYNESSGSGQQGAGYTAASTIASPGGSATASWTMGSDFWAAAAVEVQAGTGPVQGPGQQRGGRSYRSRFGRRQTLLPALLAPPVVAVSAGVAAASATAPAAGAPRAVIAGLGGTGAGYFADQGGNPRMVLGDAVWGLPGNAGRWSAGAWQADFDAYFATRSSQGFTVAYTKPMGTPQGGGINDDGRLFDGLVPFQGGSLANPSTGLTAAYWARIDYMLASAQAQGITVFLNAIGYDSDFEGGGPLSGKSAAEFQSYGAQLGARYAATPNLIWMVADDYFGTADAKISGFLTGLRGAGDTHPISIENMAESTSRQDTGSGSALTWGAANAQYNFAYSYNVTYYGVEKAYLEASPVPVIQGDGYFYQGTSTYAGGTGAFAYDRAVRQDAWHAISSGARGIIHGDEACWQWPATAQASAAAAWYHQHNAGNIRALMESLPNWHLLVPDTSSALVTAGRGTHATGFSSGGGGGQYEVAFTDSYVTASRTPSGDLAVIYLSHATTITIDQSQMVAGYAAFWADPVTGAKTAAATGSTYNSATPGSNSQGDPDWVLILQPGGPPASAPAGAASAAATAPAPTAAVSALAGIAAGSATAPAPAHAATAAAGVPSATAAAPQPSLAATVSPVAAQGTAAALAPLPAATTAAGVPAALAVAPAASVSTSAGTNAPAGVAAAAASAPVPVIAVTAGAGVAAGAGIAPQSSVSTSGSVNAAASGSAPGPGLTLASRGVTGPATAAAGTAAAATGQAGRLAAAGVAAGTGAAPGPVLTLAAFPAAALAAAVSLAPLSSGPRNATSAATVTATRTSAAAVTARRTSAAAVTRPAASASSVTDG